MAFPVAAGHPQHSGVFIPEIWSGRLVPKFYDACTVAAISNTDYEGEIKSYGDQVNIRNRPDINIKDYTKGMDLNYEHSEGEVIELLIDKGKYFAYPANHVDIIQADINLMDEWANDASEQMKISIDTDVLEDIVDDAHASNYGSAAGRKSGDIDLGVSGDPVDINGDTVVDKIVDLGVVLDEQNVPESGRFLVVPAWFAGKIKRSELKDASITGDGSSMLRNGRMGVVDRFTIYQSNLLPNVTDGSTSENCFYVLAGHKTALTFATQVTELEDLPNPNDFGKLIRGLQVFGYKIVKPESLAVMYCTKKAEA